MVEIRENVLDVDTYLMLRDKVGWVRLSQGQAEQAVNNCLYSLCAYIDGVPAGMGRIVGDGAVISYVQDLVVIPEAQGLGVGSRLLSGLKEFVVSITEPGTCMMFCLMCAKGREEFYLKHGFMSRPTDGLGPGMITYIRKDKE